MSGEEETLNLVAFSESQRNTKARGGTEDDSDEEEDPRGHGGRGGGV